MGYIRDCYYCDETDDNDRGKQSGTDKDCCLFSKHPQPKKILLECGCNPQDAIFEIYYGHVKRCQKFDLDRVLIDTTCLCRPIVKIEFSSIIYFKAEAKNGVPREIEDAKSSEKELEVKNGNDKELEIDLLFELVRVCNGVEECVQSWRYKKEYEIDYKDKLEVKSSEPFTVTFCDRACSDCCSYKMIVRGKDFDGYFNAVRVVKSDLSAFAQGLCND